MSTQSAFLAAMLTPDAPIPEGLLAPRGRPAGNRFSVYRNNVAVSLTEALEQTFPVLRALVGAEFFSAMAGIFLRAHPPQTPVLAGYGAAMPGFLESFDPVAGLPYLPDVARLELAIGAAYHAADATPVAPETLARIDPVAFLGARLTLAPALRLIRSDWPVATIWHAHQEPALPEAANLPEGPQDTLITRPAFDPRVHRLPTGGGGFVAALIADQPLGVAAEAAPEGFDLGAVLRLLLAEGAITAITTGESL
ncbi:hypothetical protein U879_18360 [Defluviimonas sp. 20V17]|uniref:DNA-binding domain-containing protein n=1 Tax=Allgaiera indica TaxID=765699 RepID=A0AAN4US41_9RHOB|nr:DNA-binding domain-containing protein [Allgaiera indica]KDB02233.1 hypothetical protein U879_18360 [Defluviimonas sp. 20V17]GHE02685.1 DUF2063 domain-containing protein [Allgaiera indica]SDX19256.1 Putative DNA-binding domain-containing protein [Allgaiera indica]